MKFKFHIPTQSYGFLEIEGVVEELKEAERVYNTYAENPVNFKKGKFIDITSFTGEQIRYNKIIHEYTDLQGNRLLSASQYTQSLQEPFPKDEILPKMEKKYGVPASVINDMWKMNGETSRLFGEALHLAMEQWFKHRKNGTEKNYHLVKNLFLRNAVMTFPLNKEENALPEVLVSDIKNGRVGRIDLLTITDEKTAFVDDYKSDADIEKNLPVHFNQLSFYAEILKAHGWTIPKIRVWNYVGDKWKQFISDVLEIKTNI